MNKPPANAHYAPSWFHDAAEAMIRHGISFREAAADLGVELDLDEATKIQRRKDFQNILRSEKNKFYAGIANDPTRTKSVAIGKMEVLVERLILEGKYDQAIAGIEKLAKIEGWIGSDSSVNIFSGLSARDIAEARERIAGKRESIASAPKLPDLGVLPSSGQSHTN